MFTKKVGRSWVWLMIRVITSYLLTKGAFQIVFEKTKIGTDSRGRLMKKKNGIK